MNLTLSAAAGPAQSVLENELSALKAKRQTLEAELRQLQGKIENLERKLNGNRCESRLRAIQPQIM